jgi:hypothetical protein
MGRKNYLHSIFKTVKHKILQNKARNKELRLQFVQCVKYIPNKNSRIRNILLSFLDEDLNVYSLVQLLQISQTTTKLNEYVQYMVKQNLICIVYCNVLLFIPTYMFRPLHSAIFRIVPTDAEYNCVV